jgi:hypothetical protein
LLGYCSYVDLGGNRGNCTYLLAVELKAALVPRVDVPLQPGAAELQGDCGVELQCGSAVQKSVSTAPVHFVWGSTLGVNISVGSVYANQKGKSDQTSLVPILNMWVIIVGGLAAHVIHSTLSSQGLQLCLPA